MIITNIFKIKIPLGLALAMFLTLFISSSVMAASSQQDAVCQGSDFDLSTDVSGACSDVKNDAKDANGSDKVNNLITQIVNIFSVIVGIVAVIMIIYGGFRYITSGGESANITSAKNTILFAIVGLIIVALAQIIVKFILAKVT